MMDERKNARTHARTDGQTDGRTWATLNALPHATNSGGITMFLTTNGSLSDNHSLKPMFLLLFEWPLKTGFTEPAFADLRFNII